MQSAKSLCIQITIQALMIIRSSTSKSNEFPYQPQLDLSKIFQLQHLSAQNESSDRIQPAGAANSDQSQPHSVVSSRCHCWMGLDGRRKSSQPGKFLPSRVRWFEFSQRQRFIAYWMHLPALWLGFLPQTRSHLHLWWSRYRSLYVWFRKPSCGRRRTRRHRQFRNSMRLELPRLWSAHQLSYKVDRLVYN